MRLDNLKLRSQINQELEYEKSTDHGSYLSLDELKTFFCNRLNIPLPSRLFPSIEPIVKNIPETIDVCVENAEISSDKNLKWKDITITFLSDVEMHIQFKEDGKGKNVTRRFDHIGFGDGRKGNDVPIQAWTVLYYAAKEQSIPHTFNNRSQIESNVKTIRQKLKHLFPNIEEDPIPHIKNDSSYHFAFHLNPPE